MQKADGFSFWTPNRLVTLAPKGDDWRSDCGSQVRNAGIMADKQGASGQVSCKFGQWQGTRDLKALTRKFARKAIELSLLGFPADEQDSPCSLIGYTEEQLGPIPFRPILLLASAARVDGQKIFAALGTGKQSRRRIGIENSQSLQRT